MAKSFSTRLLQWFDSHGRKDLPWQQDITPYRVWVSEIMLQQTQVATVIPYYRRFMDAMPSVSALAAASEDAVLQLWTGLGYYSRARNLHKCARIVTEQFNGEFPIGVEALESLPGIGKSTAGAIAAIAQGQWATILDGNVKRVLARHHAIAGWPGKASTLKRLWQAAEHVTPQDRVADYTQAIMDLGATVCTRSSPKCEKCPVATDCEAKQTDRIGEYPGKKPRKSLPIKQTALVMAVDRDARVLMEKRPAKGIWGGLWSFPEAIDERAAKAWAEQNIAAPIGAIEHWKPRKHTFSHYHLVMQPVLFHLQHSAREVRADDSRRWLSLQEVAQLGLAAPIKRLLQDLEGR